MGFNKHLEEKLWTWYS